MPVSAGNACSAQHPYSRVILRVLPKNPQGCFAPQTPLSMTPYSRVILRVLPKNPSRDASLRRLRSA